MVKCPRCGYEVNNLGKYNICQDCMDMIEFDSGFGESFDDE